MTCATMAGQLPATSNLQPSTSARFIMYNYIPHPSNARVASAILNMRIEEGAAGYGIYWMILELLRDAPSFRFSSNVKALAFAINETDLSMVERVIRNYGLFDFDGDGLLWSPWLEESMGNYQDKKEKLKEAGRKGAAKRWAAAHKDDGQAIATPSMEDRQAIAHNVTQHNITEQNVTQQNQGEGRKVGGDYVNMLLETSQEGHAPGYVAQVCQKYGCLESTCEAICFATNNAEVDHPTFIKFQTIVKRIQAEKWVPNHPDAFFTKKILE